MGSRNDLGETEEQLIARFASGLKVGVQEKMQLHTVVNLCETINMAEHIEKFNAKSWKPSSQHATVHKEGASNSSIPNIANPKKGPILENPKDAKGKDVNPYPYQPFIKCYRCNGIGHKSNVCPKRGEANYCEHHSEDCPPNCEGGVEGSKEEQPPDERGNHLSYMIH